MELTDGFAAVVEKVKREERPPSGLMTSIPKLLALLPKLTTIVKEEVVTFSTWLPLSVASFTPLLLKTSTTRPDWKLLPLTFTFWLALNVGTGFGLIELTAGLEACVEKVKRGERPPFGFTTSIPKVPAVLPRLITIVNELGFTF